MTHTLPRTKLAAIPTADPCGEPNHTGAHGVGDAQTNPGAGVQLPPTKAGSIPSAGAWGEPSHTADHKSVDTHDSYVGGAKPPRAKPASMPIVEASGDSIFAADQNPHATHFGGVGGELSSRNSQPSFDAQRMSAVSGQTTEDMQPMCDTHETPRVLGPYPTPNHHRADAHEYGVGGGV